MNTRKRGLSSLLMVLVAVLLVATGCAPTRIGVSWPVMQPIELNGKLRVLVAYNQVVTLIQPHNGTLARLEDASGDPRTDESGNPLFWTLDGHQYENAQFFARGLDLGEALYLLPAYNNRLLTVDMLRARPDSTAGIPLPAPVIADVAVSEDTLYVPLKFGSVVALDRDTYAERWTAITRDGAWSAPLLVDGVLYVSSVDHHLYAFDAETGAAVWEEPVNLQGLAGATPLYHDGFLYVGSYSHHVYKISTAGEIVASFKANNWVWSTPVLYDGLLYVTDLSGYVFAINPEDMTQVWATKAATRGIRPGPLVTEDMVVVASRDGFVYWLSRQTGDVLDSYEIQSRPEILSDLVLIPASEPQDRSNPENIDEPLILVSTTNTAHLVVAVPLDYTNDNFGWNYSR
ncbi:MAG: PQQ-binding-like beta-propeller repeat protein [Anaerolineae bacterium]|nr:PQQ-binding-like beta-propeller repeat protein [Anaerolineae bacterium]